MGQRKSYEESCEQLIARELLEEAPAMPERVPSHDDEKLGVEFFRTALEGEDLSGLTLPRTFFGCSEVAHTSFRDTNLSESCLCWNDFNDVDFSGADLRNADLRCSVYRRVNFAGAKLDGADLRRATFEDCRFSEASMSGAILAEKQKAGLQLSGEQGAQIAWVRDEGPEPNGG